MMKRWLGAFALPVLLTISLAPSVRAQAITVNQAWSSPEEVRTEVSKIVTNLSNLVPASDQSSWAANFRQKNADLQQQVGGLSPAALDQLGKMIDRQSCGKLSVAPSFSIVSAKLSLRGGAIQRAAISPPDFSSAVAGTTCGTTATDAATLDGERIGLYVAQGLSLVGEVACDAIVEILGEGTTLPQCIAFGVVKAIELGLASALDHQEFCNGLLDGANSDTLLADVIDTHTDVENGFTTTNTNITNLNTHLTNVDNHVATEFTALDTHVTNVDNHVATEFTDTNTHITNVDNHIAAEFATLTTVLANSTALLNADLRQVMKLEMTPDGQRVLNPLILTCTGTNCPNVLAKCPAAGCSWNNVGPLP